MSRQVRANRLAFVLLLGLVTAVGSLGGTSTPVRPSDTISGVPPTEVATTGTADAIASRMVSEIPSVSELLT